MAKWFLRKLCFNTLMGLHYERTWLKGQPRPLELNNRHCLLTYQGRITILASKVFKKSTLKKKSKLNALGSKFELGV